MKIKMYGIWIIIIFFLPLASYGECGIDLEYVKEMIFKIEKKFGEDLSDKDYTVFVTSVVNWLVQFTENPELKEKMQVSLNRSGKYIETMKRIFIERNLPYELAYIPHVESFFNTNAISRAGAKGIWQFMPETARRYGLEVSRRIDEREDREKSTVAAAEYLRDLLCIFGSNSYLFAIAAYNAGENNVVFALKHIENPFTERSFWNIREYLPEETQEFVPKVIAAIIIAENPSLFCFTPP